MVTRYTIDQILSYAHTTPTFPYNTTSSSPPTGTPPSSTPTPRLSRESPPPADREDNKSIEVTKKDDIHKCLTPMGVKHLEDAESPTESPTEKDAGEGTKEMDILEEDISRPTLARPVALRIPQRPNMTLHERPTLETTAGDPRTGLRPEVQYGGAGYDVMSGLGVGGGVYGLMLRQYMEAHYRGLANSGTYLPLPYPVLDPGLAYPLVGRSRRRGGQVRFTCDQTSQLEAWFSRHKYITPPQRKTIARDLNLQERQVKTWFQNRRAKWRKVQAQNGEGAPPENTSSPATSHDGSEDDPMEEDHLEEGTDRNNHSDSTHQGGKTEASNNNNNTKEQNKKSIPWEKTNTKNK